MHGRSRCCVQRRTGEVPHEEAGGTSSDGAAGLLMSALAGGEGSQEAPCLPAGLWAASGTASVPLLNPFPMPHVPGPKLPGKALRHLRSLAAPCRSRQLCRKHLLHNVNGVIDFLNWMTGHRGQIAAGEASDAQVGVRARVAAAVRGATSGSPAIPNTRSAFLELTKGRSLYGDSANVN